jgi:hypothetical protein
MPDEPKMNMEFRCAPCWCEKNSLDDDNNKKISLLQKGQTNKN